MTAENLKLDKRKRQNKIIEMVKENNYIQISELAEVFNVTTMTLRRDFEELAQEGKLQRIHGGARIQNDQEEEEPYIFRTKEYSEEKAWIGMKAASLVDAGDVIAIDVGSTLLEVAKNLDREKAITVITHWIPNIQHLYCKSNIKTIVLGGILYNKELSMVGKMTSELLSNFQPSKVFLGVSGISVEQGIITDYSFEESEIKKDLIRQGYEIIVVADSSKIDKIAPIKVCAISEIDKLVTDRNVNMESVDKLRQAGIEVIIAGPEDN
jgi:Transcriptional regulators of sugar metabolism